jgi:hypothetical protein
MTTDAFAFVGGAVGRSHAPPMGARARSEQEAETDHGPTPDRP